jgi:ABC-2 type transport system ATP-binding protein
MEHEGIEAEGLVRAFKGGIRAVDGVSLSVIPGEIYGFLGPNGAGKSTTVHMLTTLLPLTGGKATVAGFDVGSQGREVRQAVGAALQEVALDPHLSGREHVRLQASLHGLERGERTTRAAELLERVGLVEAADRKVATYSGGMKRRLDLALALVHHPRVLFLDEPTTGLDPQSRVALWEEVRRLARHDGVTVFLTTQYLEEADVLADRVGIIDHGRIVAEGTPEALKRAAGQKRIEVVPANPADWARVAAILASFGQLYEGRADAVSIHLPTDRNGLGEILRALDDAGVAVEDVALRAPSLDDVFLEKTGRSLEGDARAEEEVAA